MHELLLLKGGITLCSDFRFTFTIGRFGFLEHAYKMLTLWLSLALLRVLKSIFSRLLTLLTTFPDLLITVIVSPRATMT